jgi:hypothetical protein
MKYILINAYDSIKCVSSDGFYKWKFSLENEQKWLVNLNTWNGFWLNVLWKIKWMWSQVSMNLHLLDEFET